MQEICHRNLTEIDSFLEIDTKLIYFCGYLRVTAEIESLLEGFCKLYSYRNLIEMNLFL